MRPIPAVNETHTKRTERFGSFTGKRVVITGGSRGLGLAIARRLAREGAILAILARDTEELARAKNELGRTFFGV
jgi:NAD(P)-dependent dehydrogenase (short-subunit alcohol dehydrogenase family)